MRSLLLVLVSGIVLLSSPVALALAIWLVVLGWPANFFAFLGAGVLLVLALLLRPRPYRVHRSDRSGEWDHPRLHGLVADVARSVDASPPSVLAVDASFEGLGVRSGLRQRRTLVLGLPLLVALPSQSWVALIAREMARLQRGRALRDSLASLAAETLDLWIGVLGPMPSPRGRGVVVVEIHDTDDTIELAGFLSRTVGRVLVLFPLAWRRVLAGLQGADARTTDLEACRRAAEIAGTEATVDLLAHAAAGDLLDDAIHRVATGRTDLPLWDEVRQRFREGRDRLEALRAEDPRVGSLRDRPVATPRHRLSPPETDSILRELEDVAARVERDVVQAYRYEWQQD